MISIPSKSSPPMIADVYFNEYSQEHESFAI
jgi:hypothetical protein